MRLSIVESGEPTRFAQAFPWAGMLQPLRSDRAGAPLRRFSRGRRPWLNHPPLRPAGDFRVALPESRCQNHSLEDGSRFASKLNVVWTDRMISFIVPAYNEELLIGRSVSSIHAAARECGIDYELIVVDDASTDRTADIARELGARIVRVEKRQIAAVRNAGANEARGDLLVFIDADTWIEAPVVRDILTAVEAGAIGGGCLFRFDGHLPLWARLTYPIGIGLFRLFQVVGGCCLFCTREALETIGGFSEQHFAAEELIFRNALRRTGKFVIPCATCVTSGRKLRTYSGFEIVWTLLSISLGGAKSYRSRERLDVWYGDRRPDPHGVQEGQAP